MSRSASAPTERLLLDACCVINLYASARMEAILSTWPVGVAVADYVRDTEALAVRAGTDASALPAEQIDLARLIGRGWLELASLHDTEAETFVNLAAVLGGDGEAATAAIAIHRGWAMATDDRRATTVLGRLVPQLRLITTPELLRHWAQIEAVSPEVLRQVLSNVRTRARYEPRGLHPLRGWWLANR
ncbi:MAG: hypothetical protein IT340_22550 [Chloroflexi bacterium]|nr:hypothetical protein [Chloroflexota bacterium]